LWFHQQHEHHRCLDGSFLMILPDWTASSTLSTSRIHPDSRRQMQKQDHKRLWDCDM
jgi:hypothetical protein